MAMRTNDGGYTATKRMSDKQALATARKYGSAKEDFQRALVTVVDNLFAGSGGLNFLREFLIEGKMLILKRSGAWQITSDGEALVRYIKHGLGFVGVFRWDDETGTLVWCEGFAEKIQKINTGKVAATLNYVRWDEYKAKPAAHVFNLETAVLRLIKRAEKEGVAHDQIVRTIKKAIAA